MHTCFYSPCNNGECDNSESTYWVDSSDCVAIPIGGHKTTDLSHLEDDQSSISTNYDHI